MRTTRVIALTVLLLALPLVGGCATKTNAATGQRQFDSLSREQEIAMGEASMPELIQAYGGAVPSAGAQQYVTDIGRRMSALTEADYPSLPWEFTFLNSDVINAFALPGGKVFVTRGLVERMTNEAQLAGVIGHEIGHVTAEHIDDQLTKQRSIQIAGVIAAIGVGIAAGQDNAAVGAAAGGAILTGAGLYSLTFGRDDELEADELGMRYMTRAGYHPRGMRQLMEILAEASSGARQPEFLSTHPHPETRIRAIDRRLDNEYADVETRRGVEFYEARFQTRFLPMLGCAPYDEHADVMGAVADLLGDPTMWCGVCAARAAAAGG